MTGEKNVELRSAAADARGALNLPAEDAKAADRRTARLTKPGWLFKPAEFIPRVFYCANRYPISKRRVIRAHEERS